ncbi:putative acetyltransferase A, auxiliary subunit [Medicago truncatula]|uniref:Kinesin light chain-like protein, putative n=2 Tax=Medicago truncatula TaxID=3880 RepID=G7J7G9_MEDTR|nr:nephrocystin-3 [Medicago truncatula]AES72530.2 kinesin light chain-like protein, putative [Medicago truncatula]RHN69649.1 putative acetyltransferase A, auxiliary subunit [Medicago truncatula]
MEASSCFVPSPSFIGFRTSKDRPHVLSLQEFKRIISFSVCNQKQNYNEKLYIIPIRTISRFCISRSFAKSLELGGTGPQSDALLGYSAPDEDNRSNFDKELEELFGEVKKMIKMGKKSDAIDLLNANYEMVKERLNAGTKGIEEAAILDILALGYMAVGDLKSVGYLLNSLKEVVDTLKDDAPHLDSIVMHMGNMYATLNKFEESLNTYQRAVYIVERIYGKDSTILVTPHLGMAKALGSIGKATKAVEIYQHVITLLESNRGAESKDLVVPLLSLGNLLLKEGRANDAESRFSRVLNIYTKVYGENDGRIGMAMSSLAQVKCALGKTDEAIHLFKRALKVMKDSNYMSPDNSIMEKMRVDLAELLHTSGRGQKGREILEECLLITERYKGKEHPSLATHMINLATSYTRSKNYAEAEHLLRRSLQIMIKHNGTDDQSISFPMLQLAATLYHLKNDEEAEKLALEVLRIREKAFGDYSLPVGEALDCLVSIQARLGKDDSELLELLRRILIIQEKGFGHESEQVLLTLKKIVYYLDKLGRKDEKLPLQRRLSVLRKKYKHMIHQ